MMEKRDPEIPRKIDLYAISLLSIERKGYVDSVIVPENFTGEFYSFSSPDSNKNIKLSGKEFPLFSRKIYFKGQPIGIFTHPESSSLNTVEVGTRVYYSQEESSFPSLNHKVDKWQSFPPSNLEEKSFLISKKTELYPIFATQERKKKTSILFEYKKEGYSILWLPCTISPWLIEAIKSTFPAKIYGEIFLKPLYSQYSEINLSLLFIFISQLLYVGLKEEKNIHLHADTLLLRKSSNPTGALSSFYSRKKLNNPAYHELTLNLPFSLRWYKEEFKKSIQELLSTNLFPEKISISLSQPENHPLFYTGLEDLLIPICDLVHEHIETYLKDSRLSYYKGYLDTPSKKKTVLSLLTNQSDFLRKDYSYARQEIFAHEKFSFPIKKGIGLSLFHLGLDLCDHSFDLHVHSEKKIITLDIPQLPVHMTSISLFQKALCHYFPQNQDYELELVLQKMMMNFEPTFREEWDWQLDRPLSPSPLVIAGSRAPIINFDPILKSQLIGCVVELKSEPWIYEIEIISIHVVMQKGKKEQISLERDRLLTIIQNFLYHEIPEHLKIINNWESCLNIRILEEGSGSFINLPYAFRNAFFTALRQTNVLPAFKGQEKTLSNYEEEGTYDS